MIRTLNLFLLTSVLLFSSQLCSAESVKISTTEYSPFTTSTAKYNGFVNRVIKEAFKREGIDVEFHYVP